MGEKVAPLSPAESASPKEEPGSPEGQPSRLGDGSTRTSEATLLAEDRLAHPKKRTLREHIAITMEDPEDSKLAKGISVFMMFVILISTICFILESEVCDGMAESCQTPTTGFLPWDPWSYIFYYMEWISVLIFTADYCTRFACCGGPKEMWSFFWNIMNMIDLVAWLPFWLIGAASSPPFGLPERDASGVGGVGFVRAIRLVRVFRVFKAGKLRLGIKLFSGALVASIEPMSILCLVLTVTVIIFSSIIWLMEKPSSPLVSDHLCVTTGMCDTSDPRQGMQVVMPLHPATPPPLHSLSVRMPLHSGCLVSPTLSHHGDDTSRLFWVMLSPALLPSPSHGGVPPPHASPAPHCIPHARRRSASARSRVASGGRSRR